MINVFQRQLPNSALAVKDHQDLHKKNRRQEGNVTPPPLLIDRSALNIQVDCKVLQFYVYIHIQPFQQPSSDVRMSSAPPTSPPLPPHLSLLEKPLSGAILSSSLSVMLSAFSAALPRRQSRMELTRTL